MLPHSARQLADRPTEAGPPAWERWEDGTESPQSHTAGTLTGQFLSFLAVFLIYLLHGKDLSPLVI